MKSFGQREKLTRRLKRILTGYPFDKEVLKELVQNADDAGANKIVFIVDPRQLPVCDIAGHKWDTIQGPSLCVYNDQPFTKADIQGIQNLGEGSKGEDPTKTGQYGVGFNAVYHFTDTPTFISQGPEIGHVLCALDPHHRYVPGASSDSPGCMFDDIAQLRKDCPWLLDGYLEHIFSPENSTMFRFPMRTEMQAKASSISKSPVSTKEVQQLLENLKEDMHECLLFLNNLTRIEVGEIDKDGTFILTYWVDAFISGNVDKRREFNQQVFEIADQLKSGTTSISEVKQFDVSYQIKLTDCTNKQDHWNVIHGFGFDDPSSVPRVVQSAYENGDIGMLPRGGVAQLLSSNHIKVEETYQQDHRLFCFLPLPTKTQLPMHINGHFALDHECRRGLWHDDGKGYRTAWNHLILQHTIAPLYLQMIMSACNSIPFKGHLPIMEAHVGSFYKLFPAKANNGSSYMDVFTKAVYKMFNLHRCLPICQIENNELKLKWSYPKDCLFDSLTKISDTDRRDATGGVFLRCDIPLLLSRYTPDRLFANFHDAGVDVQMIDATNVIKFLANYKKTSHSLKKMANHLPTKISETPFNDVISLGLIYRYCIQENTKQDFMKNLPNMPILISADQKVRLGCTKTPFIFSKYVDLAVGQEHLFLHQDIHIILYFEALTLVCECPLFEQLTVMKMSDILPKKLRQVLLGKKYAKLDSLPALGLEPNIWLNRIWEFLSSTIYSYFQTRKSNKKELLNVLSPMNQWCIVPARDYRGDILLPLEKAPAIVDLEERDNFSHIQTDLCQTLLKLGLPKPLYMVFPEPTFHASLCGKELLQKLVTDIYKPDGILYAIGEQQKEPFAFLLLSKKDAKTVMMYFELHLEQIKDVPGGILTLQRIPGYETIQKKMTTINGLKCFVLPKSVPNNDVQLWTEETDVMFLMDKYYMSRLMKHVGCKFLTVSDTYIEFIFKSFHRLSDKGRYQHLQTIREYTAAQKCNLQNEECRMKDQIEEMLKKLWHHLKELCFLNSLNGDLLPASHFYDPDIEIFTYFQEEDEFPPAPYNEDKWKSFLQECGLVWELTAEKFISYARKLSENQWKINSESENASKALLDHMFMNEELQTPYYLHIIEYIPFISPHEVNEAKATIHPQYRQRQNSITPITFAGSVFDDSEDLTWTNKNILPAEVKFYFLRKRHSKKSYLIRNLRIIETPSSEDVVEHAENICERLLSCRSNTFQRHINNLGPILHAIFRYLKTNAYISSSLQSRLSKLKCILIQPLEINGPGFLMRASQLSHEGERIGQYLVPFPHNLFMYRDLIVSMGMEKTSSPKQYAVVLEEIAGLTQPHEMGPNDREAASKAMAFLIKALVKSKKMVDNISKLFLPGSDGSMHKAQDLIYCDDNNLRKRLPDIPRLFTITIDECDSSLSPFDMLRALQRLPENLKPKRLSDIFYENVNEVESEITSCMSAVATHLQTRLDEKDFVLGLLRLVFVHELNISSHEDSSMDIDEPYIKERISRIKVKCAKNLTTHLLEAESRKVQGLPMKRSFFIPSSQHASTGDVTIYVATEPLLDDSKEMFFMNCAQMICHMLDGHTYGQEHFLCRILQMDSSSIGTYLCAWGIPQLSNKSLGIEATAFHPEVGAFVPVKFHYLLCQEFQYFEKGEIVAVEMHDPLDDEEPGDPTFKFARMIGRVEENDVYMYLKKPPSVCCRYKIQDKKGISDDCSNIYSASRLYKFHIDATKHCKDDASDLPSFTEIKDSIRVQLKDAKTLSSQDTSRVIKRLYLKWQTEKNNEHGQNLCQRVCEFLEHEVRELEESNPFFSDDLAGQDHSTKKSRRRSGGQNTIKYMETRAQEHELAQHEFEERLERSTELSGEAFFNQCISEPNPQPGESRRWLIQAQRDLKSGYLDVKHDSKQLAFCEWICYKFFKAVEKALRAVQFSLDANKVTTWNHDVQCQSLEMVTAALEDLLSKNSNYIPDQRRLLTDCLAGVTWSDVKQTTSVMQDRLMSPVRMQYPDDDDFPNIPGDAYNVDAARNAARMATRVVGWAKEFVHLKW